MELIDKSALVAELEKLEDEAKIYSSSFNCGRLSACKELMNFLDTLEVKEVNIASMADEYYNALIKEAEMDVDMAGHCRLAYYTGCEDEL